MVAPVTCWTLTPNDRAAHILLSVTFFTRVCVCVCVCVCAWLRSIDKISKVTSPVLVIHGTEDEVIDFSHGLALYERCPSAVEPLWVEGAGHNDIELYSQYLERLRRFIGQELGQHA